MTAAKQGGRGSEPTPPFRVHGERPGLNLGHRRGARWLIATIDGVVINMFTQSRIEEAAAFVAARPNYFAWKAELGYGGKLLRMSLVNFARLTPTPKGAQES